MHPLRLLLCLMLASVFGHAAESSAKAPASDKQRSVEVTGLVNTPGIIFFPPERGLTITEAIIMAGGQTRRAELRDVELTRKGPDGTVTTRIIDINAIMRAGGATNVALQPGDVVFVPPRH
ncbi:MAG TPA: SLBB domain-containing protein [Opitutaceae bacterium]